MNLIMTPSVYCISISVKILRSFVYALTRVWSQVSSITIFVFLYDAITTQSCQLYTGLHT